MDKILYKVSPLELLEHEAQLFYSYLILQQ